jgi:hypothetical protein
MSELLTHFLLDHFRGRPDRATLAKTKRTIESLSESRIGALATQIRAASSKQAARK